MILFYIIRHQSINACIIIVHCTVHTRRAVCCSTKPLYIVPQTTNPTGEAQHLYWGGNAPFAPPPLVTALVCCAPSRRRSYSVSTRGSSSQCRQWPAPRRTGASICASIAHSKVFKFWYAYFRIASLVLKHLGIYASTIHSTLNRVKCEKRISSPVGFEPTTSCIHILHFHILLYQCLEWNVKNYFVKLI